MDFAEYVDKIWDGRISIEPYHTGSPGEAEYVRTLRKDGWSEVAPDIAFWPARSNVSAVRTSDGLVLIDTGEATTAEEMISALRRWAPLRVDTIIYSHGHPDHTGGAEYLDREADAAGHQRPRVVAHDAVLDRFAKYKVSAEYNAIVNRRQFQNPDITWPTEFRYPDETFGREPFIIEVGGVNFELHHGRGETDDQVWTWMPERRVLCCGDFFMWVAPNAGNPQKSQRYAGDWAKALREMARLEAEVLLPGHGYPIFGQDRIKSALGDVAEYLESLHDQTLGLMNQGASLDTILQTVTPPEHLFDRPYLRPVFDDPEFVVRNVWRFYGGWYGGDPATLKPAPERQLASELADLAGGAGQLADRARALADAGDFRLAGHLAHTAVLAAPDDGAVRAVHRAVFSERAARERSGMARALFEWTASQSADALPPEDRPAGRPLS